MTQNKPKNRNEPVASESTEEVVNISFPLNGKDADLFNRYKQQAFLKSNSEVGRQLLLRQLYEVMKQDASATAQC